MPTSPSTCVLFLLRGLLSLIVFLLLVIIPNPVLAFDEVGSSNDVANAAPPTLKESNPYPKGSPSPHSTENQPPMEISKTFITFRAGEDKGNWNEILNLYSENCKIVLIGPQEQNNFGHAQNIIELTKEEVKTLTRLNILRFSHRKGNNVKEPSSNGDDSGNSGDLSNSQLNQKPQKPQEPQEPQEPRASIVYDTLSFTKANNQNDIGITKYEIRGLRKLEIDQNNNIDGQREHPAGQFYMEIEKTDQGAQKTKIVHHAWEPLISKSTSSQSNQSEIEEKNLDLLEDKTLKKNLKNLFFKTIPAKKTETKPEQKPEQRDLQILRLRKVKSLKEVLSYLEKNPYLSNIKSPPPYYLEVVGRYMTSPYGQTPSLLDAQETNLETISDLETGIPENTESQNQTKEAVLFLVVGELQSENELIYDLLAFRVILMEPKIEQESKTAIVVKYRIPIDSINDTIPNKATTASAQTTAEEILNAMTLEEILDKL